MTRHASILQSVIVGAWVLMAPPTPLGTSLPPISEWLPESRHKSSQECEQNRQTLHRLAQLTITQDPNAPALKVAAALGQLQARCVEQKEAAPAVAADAAKKEAAPNAAAIKEVGSAD